MIPDLNILLKRAISAHTDGRISEAESLYKAILYVQPSHAATNFNIGLLYANANDHASALPHLKKSVRHAPENTQYWHLYINSLLALDEVDEAESSLRKAHSKGLKGDAFTRIDASIRIKQISLLLRKGNPHEAYRRARAAVAAYPRSAPLQNLLGSVFAGLGEWEKAIAAFQDAIALDPQFYQAFNNLGIAQQETGASDRAINSFMNCISIRPSYRDAYKNMGAVYCGLGYFYEAFLVYKNAIENNVADDDILKSISFALSNFAFPRPTPGAAEILCQLLDNRLAASPEALALAAVSLLKYDPSIQSALSAVSDPGATPPLEFIAKLSNVPLLLKLMSACPIPDLEFETFFTNLRLWLLSNVQQLQQRLDVIRFQQALALQCYITEYIYAESDVEAAAVAALETSLDRQADENTAPDAANVACLASYRALHRYTWSERLSVPEGLEALYAQQVTDSRLIRHFSSNLPVLRPIEDSTSMRVREQYEENPYPKWSATSIPQTPFSIRDLAKSLKLRLTDERILRVGAPEILVAGCGTGKQTINLAASIRNAHVVAVDLSATSIGYAKLKTQEYGLSNIAYYQGDINDLGFLNRKFDIVQCGGVLHHMADPLSGWKSVTEALKPGGLMNIALYSTLARRDIARIKSDNDASKAALSPEGLAEFRAGVIAKRSRYPDYVTRSSEFYNRSMFRDLFLHVQEVCFTIGEIGEALRGLGLAFCGFVLDERTLEKFTAINAAPQDRYDLERWQAFERENPDTFREMYQFWCQKTSG